MTLRYVFPQSPNQYSSDGGLRHAEFLSDCGLGLAAFAELSDFAHGVFGQFRPAGRQGLRCQDARDIETKPDARMDCMVRNTYGAPPLRDGHGLPIERKQNVQASVVVLGFARSPIAVIRSVVTIIVSAFNGMAPAWAVTDIGNESPKGVAPLRTDGDASASIRAVAFVSGVSAALNHCSPHIIFGTSVFHVGSLYQKELRNL